MAVSSPWSHSRGNGHRGVVDRANRHGCHRGESSTWAQGRPPSYLVGDPVVFPFPLADLLLAPLSRLFFSFVGCGFVRRVFCG
ncbi:MAG: hypothetical protein AAB281_06095, partial [Actinomycetota bacterium]